MFQTIKSIRYHAGIYYCLLISWTIDGLTVVERKIVLSAVWG